MQMEAQKEHERQTHKKRDREERTHKSTQRLEGEVKGEQHFGRSTPWLTDTSANN